MRGSVLYVLEYSKWRNKMTQLEKVKKIVRILKRKSLGESDTERIYIAYLIIEALDEPDKVVVDGTKATP